MGQEERVLLVALGRVTRDHLECPKSHFRINSPLHPVRVALVSRCVRVITITKKTNHTMIHVMTLVLESYS